MRGRRAIPLAQLDDFGAARRRTTLLRALLGLLVAGTALAAVVEARGREGVEARLLPSDGSSIVTLDVSASMEGVGHRRVGELLRALADGGRATGLIVFSDVAYELLPPGAPAKELEPLLRFFRWEGGALPVHPWAEEFAAGTRISEGLEAARSALTREQVERGTVVLVSDLDYPSSDLARLTAVVTALEASGTQIKIVPLFPTAEKRRFFERVVGTEAFLTDDELAALDAGRGRRERGGDFPWGYLALASLLTLGVAANERWNARLLLPRPAEGPA